MTNEAKIVMADKIIEAYFNRNFGSMSKMDFETLLFSEYVEYCKKNQIPTDEYTLSKKLGITQSRVRSLNERKELKYPQENFKWEQEFAAAVKNAKYDKNDHYIKMVIEDVNVMTEIRHYIEQQGWFDEITLNKKLLRIPLDCFIDICLKDSSMQEVFSDETKQNIKKLGHSENEVKAFLDEFNSKGLKALFSGSAKNLCVDILKKLPINGFGKIAIDSLAKIIS